MAHTCFKSGLWSLTPVHDKGWADQNVGKCYHDNVFATPCSSVLLCAPLCHPAPHLHYFSTYALGLTPRNPPPVQPFGQNTTPA
ncbi:unnamed protein product [Arctogadus glacialis]